MTTTQTLIGDVVDALGWLGCPELLVPHAFLLQIKVAASLQIEKAPNVSTWKSSIPGPYLP
jgi:hypothetical protein